MQRLWANNERKEKTKEVSILRKENNRRVSNKMVIYHPELKGFARKAIRELCKRVGADFNKIDFKKEGWFTMFSWTEKEQDDYKKWLVKEMQKQKEYNFYNKRFLEDSAAWFVLDFGWKLKEEKNDKK